MARAKHCLPRGRSDVRCALLDIYKENEDLGEDPQADELMTRFEAAVDEPGVHVINHRRRADELASLGEESAAAIHRAMSENIDRNQV